MCRRSFTWLIVLLGLAGSAAFLVHPVWSAVVAEWSFANCADWQNCGNCLLGFTSDPTCASGVRCVAFKGTATHEEFKHCIPSTDGNHHCEVDDSENPDIWCQGFYKKCGCFDATTSTCPNAPCNCNWGMMPDGAARHHVNGICII